MEQYEGSGKLAAFTVAALVIAVAIGIGGALLGIPSPISVGLAVVVIFGIGFILRKRETGRWSYEVQHYRGEVGGRSVELLFNERWVGLNRLTLLVDGEEADSGSIFYGQKELQSGTGEGAVSVTVGSGWVGVCTGAVARVGGEETELRAA